MVEIVRRRCHYCFVQADVEVEDPLCPNCGYTGFCYECGDPIDVLLADPCYCIEHMTDPREGE